VWGRGIRRSPPIISGRQECPGLAEKGLNTSSPRPRNPPPKTFPISLPATRQAPTRQAEGTETDLTHTSSGATETSPSTTASRQLTAVARDRIAGLGVATPREP